MLTWVIGGPNSNSVEPIRSNGCPGLEKPLEGTANVLPPCVDFPPCLPDEVVREFERVLRLYGAVAEEWSF
jgi:hypothetical protein